MTDDEGDAGGGADDVPLNIAGHEERDRDDESDPSVFDEVGGPAGTADGGSADGNGGNGNASGETEEAEPVEVLVGLAEDGEIDPWDIDIVAVTDKFLARLDGGDLRTSGRALFYASVLLRMKSDALLGEDEPDEEEPTPWETPLEEGPVDEGGPRAAIDPFDALDEEMERRLERKRARGMPETLDELVRELRDRERGSFRKESREYDTSGSPRGFSRGTQTLDYRAGDDMRVDDEPTAADVTGTAHAEDIEATIEDVHATLREQYEAGRDEVLYREVETAGGSRVETFLALLFLAHRGQVRLQQDELFGDLWVQDPTSVAGSEEAIAD